MPGTPGIPSYRAQILIPNAHLGRQSRWYNLRQDRLRAPTGHEFTYTLIDHPGAVWIVAVTADGQVVLIRQYRYTVDDWCLSTL